MQTLTEDLLSCLILLGILNKDRSSCKAEDLVILEEIDNILMTFSKLATMTFIKNHHNLLVPESLKMLIIIIFLYGTVQFLDSRYNDL